MNKKESNDKNKEHIQNFIECICNDDLSNARKHLDFVLQNKIKRVIKSELQENV